MSRELDELQEIARTATREALRGYPIGEEVRKQLTLGVYFDGENRIFELYIPAERPEDALIIARAIVHRVTREVSVRVFDPPVSGLGP